MLYSYFKSCCCKLTRYSVPRRESFTRTGFVRDEVDAERPPNGVEHWWEGGPAVVHRLTLLTLKRDVQKSKTMVSVAFTSDCFVNSFIMVVCKIFYEVQSDFFVQSTTKKLLSLTTIIKLFTNQSEVSALPMGCTKKTAVFQNVLKIFLRKAIVGQQTVLYHQAH